MKLVTVRIHFLSAVFGLFSTLPWQRDVTTSPLYEVSQFNVNYRFSLSVTSNEGLAPPSPQMSVSLREKVYKFVRAAPFVSQRNNAFILIYVIFMSLIGLKRCPRVF